MLTACLTVGSTVPDGFLETRDTTLATVLIFRAINHLDLGSSICWCLQLPLLNGRRSILIGSLLLASAVFSLMSLLSTVRTGLSIAFTKTRSVVVGIWLLLEVQIIWELRVLGLLRVTKLLLQLVELALDLSNGVLGTSVLVMGPPVLTIHGCVLLL